MPAEVGAAMIPPRLGYEYQTKEESPALTETQPNSPSRANGYSASIPVGSRSLTPRADAVPTAEIIPLDKGGIIR